MATKFCPKCGATIPADAKECPECMQPLSQKFASDRLVCVVCGREYELTPLGEE